MEESPSVSGQTARIKNVRVYALKANAADKFANNTTQATRTWSTYAAHKTLTFTPSAGDFLVLAAASMTADVNGGRVGARLNHSTASTTYGGRDTYVKDDFEHRVFAVSPKITLGAVSNTFSVDYHSPDNATLAYCAYSAILALRLDGFEQVFAAQDFSASPVNTTQTGYQDAPILSATPQAVEHLVIATGTQRIASTTTYTGYLQLASDNPSLTQESTQEGVNTASYYGNGIAAVITPANSVANWKWQYKTQNAAAAAYAADLSIAVLQLDATPAADGARMRRQQ